MDLMRITAMFLVMLFHVNYYNIALEEGSVSDYTGLQIWGYSFMKCISMVCVNMFILISGWYGIRPSVKKLSGLFFQIWFFSIITYLILTFIYVDLTFSFRILFHLLFFGGYWFIPAYLLLYICSPVLNSFIEHTPPLKILYVLVAYYAFQFFYGWLEREAYFDHGCSPLVFFGLYVMARYIRLHSTLFANIKIKKLVAYYGSLLLITSLLCAFLTIHYHQEYAEMLMQYSSPFNIVLSVLLLLIFSKIRVHSHLINKIGTSCFSAYLLHGSPFFYEKIYYPFGCYFFYVKPIWFSLLLILFFIIVIFVSSILIDLIRIAIWRTLQRRAYSSVTGNSIR